jgi:hypothetical protein
MDRLKRIEDTNVIATEIALNVRISASKLNIVMIRKEKFSITPVYMKELASERGEKRDSPFSSFTIFVMNGLSAQK